MFTQIVNVMLVVVRCGHIGDIVKKKCLVLLNIFYTTPRHNLILSQARAFLQPTRADIHQHQVNRPIILINDIFSIDWCYKNFPRYLLYVLRFFPYFFIRGFHRKRIIRFWEYLINLFEGNQLCNWEISV